MILEQHYQERVLVLGGTNFMGKTLLDFLAQEKPHLQVYCVNRGKLYWNNQARKYHQKYQHFLADRKQHKDTYHMILYLNEKLKITQSNPWKAVIDFSAFKWRDIQSVTKAINNLSQRYIFISSDSVYNNMEVEKTSKQTALRQDEFDIEAEYRSERKMEEINDKYGYNKLKCQCYIKRRVTVPTYCLRLPDVIGPFDNTERFWTTLEWIKASHQHPIPLSANDERRKLSFVYSHDVCRFIRQLIGQKSPRTDFINVAFRENPTFEEFVRILAKKMKVYVAFKAVKDDSNNCFPSTEFGYISINKLTQQYGFEPTNMEQAITHTILFFDQNGHNYPSQRKQMLRMLNKKIKQRNQ